MYTNIISVSNSKSFLQLIYNIYYNFFYYYMKGDIVLLLNLCYNIIIRKEDLIANIYFILEYTKKEKKEKCHECEIFKGI